MGSGSEGKGSAVDEGVPIESGVSGGNGTLAATLGVSSALLGPAPDVSLLGPEEEGASSEPGETNALAVEAALRNAALTLYGETLDRRFHTLEPESECGRSTERD